MGAAPIFRPLHESTQSCTFVKGLGQAKKSEALARDIPFAQPRGNTAISTKFVAGMLALRCFTISCILRAHDAESTALGPRQRAG